MPSSSLRLSRNRKAKKKASTTNEVSYRIVVPCVQNNPPPQVLEEMKLSKCADTLVGGGDLFFSQKGLSGGERKRLSIANEMLLAPSMIFLDEPSSGACVRPCLPASLRALRALVYHPPTHISPSQQQPPSQHQVWTRSCPSPSSPPSRTWPRAGAW